MVTLIEISEPNKYIDDNAIPDLITYICNSDHAINQFIGSVGGELAQAAKEMIWTSNHFGKNSKKRLRHFVLSFEGKYSEYIAAIYAIGEKVSEKIGKQYQVVFAVHENTEILHIHFVMNAVSFVNGKRYRGTHEEFRNILKICNKAVRKAGLGYVIPVKYKSYT